MTYLYTSVVFFAIFQQLLNKTRLGSKVKAPRAIGHAMAVMMLFASAVQAQQKETVVPLSQRMTINLAAGMPQYISDAGSTSSTSQNRWWYENSGTSPAYATTGFVESTDSRANWQQVGLPYDANVTRTFINQTSGGGQGSLTGNDNWYRLHFKVDAKYAGQKFLLSLEGAHTGVQVYINGTLLPGISQVAANSNATHVVGFIPVVVDLTPYLHADGATDNVIAVDVSRGSSWFETPNFSGAFRFGQAMAGLFRNVTMTVTNPVHIPLNVYSNTKTWGTYVGTVSEVPAAQGTASAASAVIEVQTNVLNESAVTQQVTLTTQVVDASGNVVLTAPPLTQAVAPMTAATFPSTPTAMFDQQMTIANPRLWYPNNSTYGTPYLYRVYHIVSVGGVVVDSTTSPLGIRTITWDANFPYINGHAHYLWGGSGRYDYPALGSSVPDEQVWRDVAQFAAGGGNIWRPGHSSSSEEFVEAADAYGIMIDQPSGDGEGSFTNPSADDATLKQELHRDMIIRDRSHPSILDWEMDNGGNNVTLATQLNSLGLQWDSINPRKQASRAYSPQYAYIDECDGAGCEVGNKQQNQNNPAFGAEYWDNVGTGRGLAWDYELAFSNGYLNDWRNGRANNSFGMAQWYFADTPGEVALYAEYQNNAAMTNYVRSLGYSMVDQNRFPRLLYYIYQANWTPYSLKPVVALAHHWNRAYEYTAGTPIQENAFSNCPAVRLLINGVAKDPLTGATLADQVPNAWNIATNNSLNQNTTTMPGQVHWMVNWAAGTVQAQCIDANGNAVAGATDSRTTAGAENKIVLSVVPNVVRPDGSTFQWTSNGSDAAFVVAQVQDAQGNLVPTAADNVTFSVTGPATYMGGTQQLVADPAVSKYYQDAFSQANSAVIGGVPYAFFHSPGDPELNFEGGLQKIALRSTTTAGTVTVTASAPGLASGTVQLASVTPPSLTQSQAPAIIVSPASVAVTAGYPASFTATATGSGTLVYQWFVNGTAIPNATGSTYTTPATVAGDNGKSFSVTIMTAYGAVTSNPAVLTVSAAAGVAITTQPQAQTAVVGQSATFSVTASGSPQLSYQWFVNGAAVPGATQSVYGTQVLMATGAANVYVVVSNPLGQVKSAIVALTVTAATPVSIVTQPPSQIVPVNQPVQLTAVVAGSSPYTYMWQFTPPGGTPVILISNTQASSTIAYTIPAMSTSTAGSYTVSVNNAANAAVTSAPAQITLAPPGINLALNRAATSSSSQNACTNASTSPPFSGAGCLGAENAVDGSLNTRWASQSAGQPPATPVAGVDPSWLQVDFGTVTSFNTIILNWENAYAAQYKIQYTNQDPATNPTWADATKVIYSAGGTETISFPTVQARYVRMLGLQRSTQYGYSLYEFQVYNVAQCGGSGEHYTLSTANPNLVLDNLSGLTWTRTIQTNTAPGSQFTGIDAAAYCSSVKMRLPSQAEALGISGSNNASCAFPGAWNTWTSTVDPQDAAETALVNFDGTSSYKVTNNWPGAVLCTAGGTSPQTPVLTSQPQSVSVTAGQSATFAVTATGSPAPSYQWSKNGSAIAGASAASYTTPATVAADDGSTFAVTVTNAAGSVTSNQAKLTVTTVVVTPPVGTGGTTNLALGKIASSSGDENGTLAPSNAVDGNLTTRWSSAFMDTAWMQVDLGSALMVNKVVLNWEAAYGRAYLIQGSNDGQNWMTLFTQSAGTGGTETIGFPALTTRYLRMQGISRASNYGYSLFEFQVFGANLPSIITSPASQTVPAGSAATFTVVAGSNGPFTYQWLRNGIVIAGATGTTYTTNVVQSADSGSTFAVQVTNAAGTTTTLPALLTVTSPSPSTTNLAKNRPATDSSSQDEASLGAAFAFDGNASTRWASAGGIDPSWVSVDLGSSTTINQVVLRWEAAYGKSYQIQVSIDGKTWTPVFTRTGGLGGVENISFAPVNARYVRMYGTVRATQYGYSLYEFEVYGSPASNAGNLSITTAPVNTSATVGSFAAFSVVAGGTGPFTYQWIRNGSIIAGATAPTYTTSVLNAGDNGAQFSVTVGNAAGTATVSSTAATLTVGSYTVYPGFLGVDLLNKTNGAWADAQVFVTVIGIDPLNGKFAYVTPAGAVVDLTVSDKLASNHITSPSGQSFGNYSFTLAQSHLLKLPLLTSSRAYISLGAPLYVAVYGDANGNVTGYAGPNPQNSSDPNINTHFDWYEFNYGGTSAANAVFINTTQVDEFGLPLLLDVWASGGSFHQQVGIAESLSQIDKEFAAEVPTAFQPAALSNLRIFSPAKVSMAAGGTYGNYFDQVIAQAWASYRSTPLPVTLSGRTYQGTSSGATLLFREVNPSAAHTGESFVVQQPTTQDVLGCAGTLATGVAGSTPALQDENAVQLQLQNQICAAINRGVLLTPANWANASTYYGTSPANFYSRFWHNHSVAGLAYGFSYDDNNNQSTTISTPQPEHMTFTIGW